MLQPLEFIESKQYIGLPYLYATNILTINWSYPIIDKSLPFNKLFTLHIHNSNWYQTSLHPRKSLNLMESQWSKEKFGFFDAPTFIIVSAAKIPNRRVFITGPEQQTGLYRLFYGLLPAPCRLARGAVHYIINSPERDKWAWILMTWY